MTQGRAVWKPYQNYLSADFQDLDQRVRLILAAIKEGVTRRPGEKINAANIRRMESFLAFLKKHFPSRSFKTQVQAIPDSKVRTTDRNYIVTVDGRTKEAIVLVAHYDTWAGFSDNAPGADDNTTGEEVLKHYLLKDLCADEPPNLTHVYLFSGSEECGTRGLLSQFALVLGLYFVSYGISCLNWLSLLLSLLFIPFAVYRFGVTGTRWYIDNLSAEEKAAIRAAIAVDSVGEGRLFILENEMGANFIRALFPYEGSEELNAMLEEGAHLHGIKYNRYLAGGTTDSVAFLEERGFNGGKDDKARIPAAALITMSPGKASPIVFGGKLHTKNDTPDRVYPEPLRETMTVLDYAFHLLEGGRRPDQPRSLPEHHYARLYQDGDDLFLAVKDAVEPNRRNINSIFKVEGKIEHRTATLKVINTTGWGVDPQLDREIKKFHPGARRVPVHELVVADEETAVRFAETASAKRRLLAAFSGCLGFCERMIGRYSFVTMFVTAFVVGYIPNWALNLVFAYSPVIGRFILDHFITVFVVMWICQILLLLRLFSRELPAAMDNAYRHLNRADNLLSLRRLKLG
jgi:hypothetical protein